MAPTSMRVSIIDAFERPLYCGHWGSRTRTTKSSRPTFSSRSTKSRRRLLLKYNADSVAPRTPENHR
eukprot:4141250-Pyramimonas_sp.AAC.1